MQIIKNAYIYLISNLVNKAFPFLLLPVMTHYLSVEDYGILSIYHVLLGFFIPIIGMAMQINITKNFTTSTNEELALWIGNLFGVLSLTTTIFFTLSIVYILLNGYTFGLSWYWFLSIPLVAGLNMVFQINTTLIRNQKRPFTFAVFSITKAVLSFILTVILVTLFNHGWQGQTEVIISISSTFAIASFLYIRHQNLITFKFDAKKIGELIKICPPLIVHTISIAIITLSDRLFIDQMVSKEAVGIYAVGYTFGMSISIFIEAFNLAWGPWFYEQMNRLTPSIKQRIIQYTYISFFCFILLALAISNLSFLILPYVVDEKFYGATEFIFWIAIGYSFRGMYSLVFPYLVHKSRTSILSLISPLAAILNLITNYILININGSVGAAQATFLAFLLSFIGTWLYANRINPMPWGLNLNKYQKRIS